MWMRLRSLAAGWTRPRKGERGQALFLFVLVMTVVFVIGVLGVDATLWHGERREAQKDADAAALAGGQELFNRVDVTAMEAAAKASAYQWGARNGAPADTFVNGSPQVIESCFGTPAFDGKPDGVVVDLSSPGASLFSSIWGTFVPDPGAHTKVCIGSPPDSSGLLPFGVPVVTSACFGPDGAPLFGEICDVQVRAPDGSSGETGTLTLYNDGSNNCSASNVGAAKDTFIANVANGANTTCATAPANAGPSGCPYTSANPAGIGKCVWSLTGNKAAWLIEGLQQRLTSEGKTVPPNDCDYLYPDSFFNTGGHNYVHDHIDQWWEALTLASGGDIHSITPGPGVVFERRNCTAPRLVTIVLISCYNDGKNALPPQCPPDLASQGPYPIQGFAGFYILGCRDDALRFNQHCLDNPPGNLKPGDPDPWGDPYLDNQGHMFMEGMFINYVDIGKTGGAMNKYGRVDLYLVE